MPTSWPTHSGINCDIGFLSLSATFIIQCSLLCKGKFVVSERKFRVERIEYELAMTISDKSSVTKLTDLTYKRTEVYLKILS